MSPIKFRAWDKENKKWLVVEDMPLLSNEDDNLTVFELGCDWVIFSQFTGFHDKNGKEIWEGDIVKSPGASKPFDVYFYDGAFVGRGSTKSSWIDLRIFEIQKKSITIWEVIGNIYENPELLKEKI